MLFVNMYRLYKMYIFSYIFYSFVLMKEAIAKKSNFLILLYFQPVFVNSKNMNSASSTSEHLKY